MSGIARAHAPPYSLKTAVTASPGAELVENQKATGDASTFKAAAAETARDTKEAKACKPDRPGCAGYRFDRLRRRSRGW
jgi:predicted RNA-binding Zn ribbon-like protein